MMKTILNKKYFAPLLTGLVSLVMMITSCYQYGTDNITYPYNNPDNRVNSVEDLNISDDLSTTLNLPTDSSYKVLIITDVHYGSTKFDYATNIQKFVDYINTIDSLSDDDKPKFCLCLGDVADHGWESEFAQYKELEDKLEDKGIKVINVVGNHDLYNSGWQYWEDACYPYTSFFKFEAGGFEWYGLDTGSGCLGQKQMSYLETSLENSSKDKIILTHYAMLLDNFNIFYLRDSIERDKLLKLLAENKAGIYICGHYHPYYEKSIGSYFTQYCLVSLGQYGKWTTMTVDPVNKTFTIETSE